MGQRPRPGQLIEKSAMVFVIMMAVMVGLPTRVIMMVSVLRARRHDLTVRTNHVSRGEEMFESGDLPYRHDRHKEKRCYPRTSHARIVTAVHAGVIQNGMFEREGR
jgi:hypothetical protein